MPTCLQHPKVVVSEQVVVAPRLAIVGEWLDVGEDIKHASRRVRTIVEQEHNPNVDCAKDSELARHDNGCLLIGVVVREVTHCCKQLISLVCREDEVSTPDLSTSANHNEECCVSTNLSHRMCDHVIGRHNTVVVAASFESAVEVGMSSV
jgi:hypothetical protein